MYIDLHYIRMFYEKSGEGRPLILLHGNAQSHAIFNEAVGMLDKRFTVYAPDSRGHGQTRYLNDKIEAKWQASRGEIDSKKPELRGTLSYESMADDVIEFIEKLEIEKPVLYGFSDGGIISLIVAAKRPDLVKKIMVSSVNVEPEGVVDKARRNIKISHFITHSKKKKLLLDQPHITPEEMRMITVPTVIVVGENDLIKKEHLDYIVKHIPKCRLKVLKGETHSSYVVHSRKIADLLIDFVY